MVDKLKDVFKGLTDPNKTFDPKAPLDQPINIVKGPYHVVRDGKDAIVEWNDFRYDTIQMTKYMSPSSDFYEKLCGDNAITAGAYQDTETPQSDREIFKLEWIAMFDQFRSMGADIKACGGTFVFPDYEYFKDEFEKTNHSNLTQFRRDVGDVIRECIAFNYREAERLNIDLLMDAEKTNRTLTDDDLIIPTPRSKHIMERITKDVEKSYNGRDGK